MFTKWKALLPGVCILVLTLFLFRNYFLKGLVPFPANLLVSYYEPWRSYPAPEYPNGPPNKAMGFDTMRIYYPLKTVAMEALQRLEPPLWNPYAAAGTILHATYQSATFHPFAWLFFVMPQIDAWSILVMIQPLLAFAAMFYFLSVLRLSQTSRTLGALSYATSGFAISWWQESYMFSYSALSLPIALALIERFIDRPRTTYLGVLSLALAVSIFSGAFQMTFYTYLCTCFFLIYRLWNNPDRISRGILVLISIVVSLLLGGIQIFPNIEAYGQSARATADIKYIFDSQLLPMSQLVTFLAPDYFGNPATYNYFGKGFYHERLYWIGAIPFLLLLTQAFKRRWERSHGTFFQWAFWITLSLSLSLPTSWLVLYYLKLPLLSTMTPSRILMLISFFGSVLAAFGSEDIIRGLSRRTLLWVTGIMAVLGIMTGIAPFISRYLDPKNTSYIISLRNLVIPGISFGAGLATLWMMHLRHRFRNLGVFVLLSIMAGNTFLFAQKYLYFSERRFVYPDVPVLQELKKLSGFTRFWTYDNGYIENNFASAYGLFSPEGYDSILIRRYGEFLSYANSQGKSLDPDRANALIRSTDHLNDILTDPYRVNALRILGVRYILQKRVPDRNEQKILPDPKRLPTIWQDGTYAIHEFKDALPRVLLISDIRVEPDGKKLLDSMFDPNTDIQKTLYLEKHVQLQKSRIPFIGTARISRYTANSVRMQYVSTSPSFLFLSDAWYPGWSAVIDGKTTPIYRANYAFRAVYAPPGVHTVTMTYLPRTWKVGVMLTGIGSIFVIVFFAIPLFGKKRDLSVT